jgi:hypothetical protein
MSRRVERRDRELLEVEAQLQQTLQPMPPRAEFVGSLRSQLMEQLQELINWMPSLPSRSVIIGAATFISGVFLLVMVIRVVMFIFIAFSLIRRLRQQST